MGNRNTFFVNGLSFDKIMHSENKIRSDETVIVSTVNKHFVNTTKKLKLQPTQTKKEEHTIRNTGQEQIPPKYY